MCTWRKIYMLLEFKFKNYKSFVEETTFSMMPAPKQTGLDYSVLKEKVGTKNHKALCSAVIYGPNAAGKTNIIAAMGENIESEFKMFPLETIAFKVSIAAIILVFPAALGP